jgi:hypothetical protein
VTTPNFFHKMLRVLSSVRHFSPVAHDAAEAAELPLLSSSGTQLELTLLLQFYTELSFNFVIPRGVRTTELGECTLHSVC